MFVVRELGSSLGFKNEAILSLLSDNNDNLCRFSLVI